MLDWYRKLVAHKTGIAGVTRDPNEAWANLISHAD